MAKICTHPEESIEFGEDDERGECKLCGATCDWHWENDVYDGGDQGDGNGYEIYKTRERVVDYWYSPEEGK